MTLKEAIEILTYHQLWRRGEVDEMKYSPTYLGKAIDIVLSELKKGEKQKLECPECGYEMTYISGIINPEYQPKRWVECPNCKNKEFIFI